MNQEKFDRIFKQAVESVVPTDINRHEETLQFFADECGRLPIDKAALFTYTYTVETCKELIYEVVSRMIKEMEEEK